MRSKGVSYARYGYIFCIPFVLAFLICSLYPVLYTAIIGFTDLRGLGIKDLNFLSNPFENFISIMQNGAFRQSLFNTAVIWIMNFIPQILLAFVLTSWFTRHRYKMKGQGAFKVIFYMPNIITAATVGILFYAMFSYPMGPVNHVLQNLGIIDAPYNFRIDPWAGRIIVAFIQFWMWYGYTMLILISGVLGLNTEMFESAAIDGAKPSQTFLRIIMPNMKTITLYIMVTSMIGGLQMFDIPKVFLDGMPDGATTTVSLFIYKRAFSGAYLLSSAAAASMILFVLIAVLSAFIFFIMRDRDEAAFHKMEKQRIKAMKAARRAGK